MLADYAESAGFVTHNPASRADLNLFGRGAATKRNSNQRKNKMNDVEKLARLMCEENGTDPDKMVIVGFRAKWLFWDKPIYSKRWETFAAIAADTLAMDRAIKKLTKTKGKQNVT